MIEQQFKLFQKLIDKCVKRDYDAVSEAFSMKKEYLKDEQCFDYIRKAIFETTEELVFIKQKHSAIRAFSLDWEMPDFIWETTFIESLTQEVRGKYVDFCYENFNDELYSENPTSYDDALPYFSAIVKFIVYSKFLKDLQKEEQKRIVPPRTTIISEKPKETASSKNIVGKENPFNCKLNEDAFQLLTDCVNDVRIFTTEITPQILEDFFYCRLTGALKSANNKLLAYFMMKLSMHEYITYEWQSVVANNKLVIAPKKGKYLNNSDLSSANDSIKYIPPKKSEIIDKYVKQLKKH